MGLGVQSSNSEQESNSGLLRGDKSGISSYAAGLAPQLGGSLMNFVRSQTPSFNTGRYGVAEEFDPAIEMLGNNMFNKASGNAAAKGFVSPGNLEGVIGSAVREAAPQLAQLADSAAQRRLFGPDQIMAQRFGTGQNFLTALSQLLGGSASGNSSSFGFNVSAGKFPSPTGGATG